jgi:hypothetical protein
MSNPQEGNRIILLGLAIALALAALFTQWGVLTVTMEDLRESLTIDGHPVGDGGMADSLGGMMAAMLNGSRIPVTGLNGHLSLGPLKIPNWLPVLTVIAGLIFTFTNHRQLSAVPRVWVSVLLISGIVAGAWAVVLFTAKGTLGIGGILLIAAAAIGLSQQRALPDHEN